LSAINAGALETLDAVSTTLERAFCLTEAIRAAHHNAALDDDTSKFAVEGVGELIRSAHDRLGAIEAQLRASAPPTAKARR
jgi:hypothetical protein